MFTYQMYTCISHSGKRQDILACFVEAQLGRDEPVTRSDLFEDRVKTVGAPFRRLIPVSVRTFARLSGERAARYNNTVPQILTL